VCVDRQNTGNDAIQSRRNLAPDFAQEGAANND